MEEMRGVGRGLRDGGRGLRDGGDADGGRGMRGKEGDSGWRRCGVAGREGMRVGGGVRVLPTALRLGRVRSKFIGSPVEGYVCKESRKEYK